MLSKLRIGPKLLLAPGVVLLLLMLIAAGAYFGMVRQNQSLDNIMQERSVRLRAAADLVVGVQRAHSEVYQLMTWSTAGFPLARTTPLLRAIHTRHAALERQLAQLERITEPDPAERRLVQQSQAAFVLYVKAVDDVIDIAIDDHSIAANAMSKAERAFDTVALRLEELSRLQRTLSDSDYQQAEADFMRLSIWMPTLVVLSIALSLLVTMLVRRALLAEVGEISAAALDLAEGRLTVKNRVYGRDEIAATSRTLDTSIRNLNTTLKTILASAQAMDSASRRVAQDGVVLSMQAERQAASLAHTGSAVGELGAAAEQTAGSAQLALQLARCASTCSARGGKLVERLGVTMTSMRGSSQQVAQVVDVIDGLAFEANLLAMSVAVAAARAGADSDTATGVAGEVLALARRSAAAAHDIRALVGASASEIEGGARAVDDMAGNLADIVAALRQVGELMGKIGSASAQQAQDCNGAQLAILDLERTTQQQLQAVRQATVDANSLQRQALHLSAAVARFELDAVHDPQTPAPPLPAGAPRMARLRLASVRN